MRRINTDSKKAIFLVSSLSLGAFLLGGLWTILLSDGIPVDSGHRKLMLFSKVYDLVKKQYVEDPSDDKLVEGAIRGMLDNLDPHSVYLSKEEFAEMQADTRGQFGGIGIEIAKRNGMLTVITPIEDTPAFLAGLKTGDIIAKISDQATDKMSVFDAVKLMRGKPGSPIDIWVRREGVDKLLPFKIKRAIINVKSVTSKMVDGYGVVRVKQFLEKSSEEMRRALKDMAKDVPLKGVVLDLRNNPGGLLQQAVEVVDTYIDKGVIVWTQGRDKVQVDKKFATAKGTEPMYPMVILINGGSASASEIVAGALQDHKRATIMGTQSFGKGSVQNVIPLEDGSGVKLTVALYYIPSGRTIQGFGIVPDKIVHQPDEPEALPRERDLPGHLVGKEEKDEDAKRKATQKMDASKLKGLEKEDYQLAKAIEFLKEQTKGEPKSPSQATEESKKKPEPAKK